MKLPCNANNALGDIRNFAISEEVAGSDKNPIARKNQQSCIEQGCFGPGLYIPVGCCYACNLKLMAIIIKKMLRSRSSVGKVLYLLQYGGNAERRAST